MQSLNAASFWISLQIFVDLIVFVLFFLLFINRRESSRRFGKPSETVPYIIRLIETSEGQKHRRTERNYWNFSLVLSFVATVIALIGACLAYSAYRETRRQADIAQTAYLANTRAWVKADIDVKQAFFSWDPNGANINIDVIISNEGNSPALSVDAFPILYFAPSSNTDHSAYVRTLCNPRGLGNVVFAKQPIYMQLGTVMFLSDIEKHVKVIADKNKVDPKYINFFSAQLAFCITYKSAGDATERHTIQTFDLQKIVDVPGRGKQPAAISIGENVQAGALYIARDFIGDFVD